MEETSLDRFVDADPRDHDEGDSDDAGGGGGSEGDGGPGGGLSGERTGEAGTDASAESLTHGDGNPVVSTVIWSPGGTACDACGESVERRWTDDESLRCTDCKEW